MPFNKKPAEIAAAVNRVLERIMPILTPVGVAMGVLFAAGFLKLRPFVTLLFGTMTLTGALKLKARELGLAVKSPLPIVFFFITAHLLMPLVVLLITGFVFAGDADTISGYVLLYSAPTAVTGFIWVSIFKGDPALSLALILLDTILAPIVVPGTVRLLLGTKVVLDMTGIAVSLIYMVVIPTIVGVTINEASRGKIPKAVNPYMGPLSKICMILVISANSAAVAPQINPQNPRMWIIGASCIVLSAIGFSLGRLSGIAGRLGRGRQVSLFFASGLRNTSAAMTLAIEFFPGAAALPAVLGIMFQQTMSALMGRLLMGKIPEGEKAEGEPAKTESAVEVPPDEKSP
jgi:predicted Na+-dependent transporter